MKNCNAIQKTRQGFHYLFCYDQRIFQNAKGGNYDIDTRNDGGLIVVEPSQYKIGNELVEYKWEKLPAEGENFTKISEEAIKFMQGHKIIKIDENLNRSIKVTMHASYSPPMWPSLWGGGEEGQWRGSGRRGERRRGGRRAPWRRLGRALDAPWTRLGPPSRPTTITCSRTVVEASRMSQRDTHPMRAEHRGRGGGGGGAAHRPVPPPYPAHAPSQKRAV